MKPPPIGSSAPRMRNPSLAAIGRVSLSLLGWRFEGTIPDVPKCVMIVAPHTSNWDFFIGLMAKWVLELRVRFLAKHTLFRGPAGPFLRWLGGIPIDRSAADGVVDSVLSEFARRDQFYLVLAPEGTRRKVDRWKTGFHRIAQGAEVPILPAVLDWGGRRIGFRGVFAPTDDVEADLVALQALYHRSMAYRPEQF